jgi:hypothetical protein
MPTCVRQAWLVLGGNTIQLDNPAGGYMCQSLDLGTPIMRTVMSNRPDGDGIIDRTQYMGARTVVAAITALTGAGAQIDAVAASFAPFMAPSQRPVLHYVLDRPGAPERTLTLRPDSYDWPIVGAAQRDIALQWIAPNPISYSATQSSLIVTSNTTLTSPGDVLVRPVLTVTGPVTGPTLHFVPFLAGNVSAGPQQQFDFVNTFTVAAGHTLVVDCAAHTAILDGASVLNQVIWSAALNAWPALPSYGTGGATPTPAAHSACYFGGSATTGATACVASWYDGYLV